MRDGQDGGQTESDNDGPIGSSDEKRLSGQRRQRELDEILLHFDQLPIDDQDNFKRYVQELVVKFGQ